MAFSTKFSYQRLRKLPSGLEKDEAEEGVMVVRRRGRRRWLRLDGGARRFRRPRVQVAGLRSLLRREEARMVGAAVRRVLKRLKEGRPYVGGCSDVTMPSSHHSPSDSVFQGLLPSCDVIHFFGI